jgi:SulP family sulfate permease
MSALDHMGDQAVIFELQGNLFFGNTYQLYADLEQEISTRRYVIIDLARVQSIDVTAAQLFNHIRDTVRERGAKLVLSGIRDNPANGRNLQEFLGGTGLIKPNSKTVRIFPDLDSAIGWVEDRLLGEIEQEPEFETPMRLQDMELFSGYRDETLNDLEAAMQVRSYAAGETIYPHGSPGDNLYWVRCGTVRLFTSFGNRGVRPVASFGRGEFFGGLAFLDRQPRPNDAIALKATELYVLSREQFDRLARDHRTLAFNLTMAMARTLARRLRRTENKLMTVQEY